ncbi:MAG: glycosyltransferase family 2 protein, partial [Bacteroidia bacterium]|nr:glycosyltransferase family 2 protein [Bacteroidia bacterium]
FILTFIASLKSAFNKGSIKYFINTLKGYNKSKQMKLAYLVTEDQGKFIRNLRWKGIFKKLI